MLHSVHGKVSVRKIPVSGHVLVGVVVQRIERALVAHLQAPELIHRCQIGVGFRRRCGRRRRRRNRWVVVAAAGGVGQCARARSVHRCGRAVQIRHVSVGGRERRLMMGQVRVARLRVRAVHGAALAASVLGSGVLEPHLEHTLGQPGLLRQLLEVLRVRVVIQLKVGLHHAQLVMLERGSHALLTLGGCGSRSSSRCRCCHRVVVALWAAVASVRVRHGSYGRGDRVVGEAVVGRSVQEVIVVVVVIRVRVVVIVRIKVIWNRKKKRKCWLGST